ncbi:putative mitochondrial protein [Tanacetum coccineum]
MVVSTRNNTSTPNGTPLVLDDETRRFLVETLTGLINQVMNRGPQLNHSRMAKIEFPKFSSDDVKGWVFRCEQFFLLEQTSDAEKTTAREYEDAFDNLLSRVKINKDHAVSLFMRGLLTEIEIGVRMFKPKTLADAYCLTNLQEATLNAVKKKGRSTFISNSSRYNNSPINTFQKPLLTNPTTNVTAKPNTPVAVQNRRLSQKEYVEKRANNLCFYYDQKYVPGHKCSGQLYSLVLMPEYEIEGEFLEEDEIIGDNGLVDLQAPRRLAVLKWRDLVRNLFIYRMDDAIASGGYDMVWFITMVGMEIGDIRRFNFHELRQAELHSMSMCVFPNSASTCMQMEETTTFIHPVLQQVVEEYEDVFAIPTELPPKRDHDHKIPLIEGGQLVNIRPYRNPPTQKDAIEGMVAELLQARVIKKSNSPSSSPIVMVKKKDNSWRMYVDYRQLNKQTIKDKFPIPIIEELIDELHGSQLFTKLDLRSGYHQIRMNDAYIAKIAFRTHEGHYKFLVMPFGLTNAPSTFQSLMNEVFRQYLRKFVLVFFDDVLICTQIVEDHALHLKAVEYLGHVISAKGVATDPSKVEVMSQWPLLKKNSFIWSDESQTAFEQLKQAMVRAPVLKLLDFSKEFTLETYALGVGLGAVLIQEGHQIAFLSKTLSSQHHLMSTNEKEFLAIVYALEKWRGYLLDRHFKIKTDHFSLKYLLDQRMSTPTQLKWLPKLMGFDYEIQYQKGVENVTADALSRLQSSSELFCLVSSYLTTEIYKRIQAT